MYNKMYIITIKLHKQLKKIITQINKTKKLEITLYKKNTNCT